MITTCNSTAPGAAQRQGAPGRRDKQETLMQADAARIRALRAEHRRQQEELLQVPHISIINSMESGNVKRVSHQTFLKQTADITTTFYPSLVLHSGRHNCCPLLVQLQV